MNGITDEHQIFLGFHKVWTRLADYKLDMPNIPEIYEQYAKQYPESVPSANRKMKPKVPGEAPQGEGKNPVPVPQTTN